jgi:hypothetical protein
MSNISDFKEKIQKKILQPVVGYTVALNVYPLFIC